MYIIEKIKLYFMHMLNIYKQLKQQLKSLEILISLFQFGTLDRLIVKLVYLIENKGNKL